MLRNTKAAQAVFYCDLRKEVTVMAHDQNRDRDMGMAETEQDKARRQEDQGDVSGAGMDTEEDMTGGSQGNRNM